MVTIPGVTTSSAAHRPSFLERILLGTLAYVPSFLMRPFAGRYIAGEELDDALRKLAELRAQGYPGILDILGENVTSESEAREVLAAYSAAAKNLQEHDLDAYVSVKPTHFGLAISKQLAFELYDQLAQTCAELGIFMRVEMEDHPTTDATIEIFEKLRTKHDNVGLVLQARLFRTPDDIDKLAPGPLNIRMVKGIYLEPSEIAFTSVEDIRRAYLNNTQRLFDRGAFVSLATHDDIMSVELEQLLKRDQIGSDRYEFQVLLGVREPLWKRWLEAGHPVRVYVPYGPEWRAYSLRRLSKNPELLRAIISNTFKK